MAVVDMYSLKGKKTGSVTLPSEVMEFAPNKDAVYFALKDFSLHQYHHRAKTKGRSEVRGGGRKPWRQKGTGRARAGTSRSPIWRGGGVVFGPQPHATSYKVNKKVKTVAKRSLMFWKIQDKKLLVVENFAELHEDRVPKTKNIVLLLKALKIENLKVLFMVEERDDIFYKSCRNLLKVAVKTRNELNTYDLLHHEYLVTTKKGIESIKEMF